MQDVILLLLLPMALLVVVGSLLRRAPPFKEMQPRLAAAKWALSYRVTAHHLLVRGGAGRAFCNRPPTSAASSVLSRQRHHNITSAPYGPLWRGIRRNLVSEVFHPSRLRVYAPARRRALCGLVADLREQCTSSTGGVALAAESIHAALFGLSATMCFGDGVDPGRVRAMADGMEDLIRSLVGLRVFAALPALTELIYRDRWNNLVALRRQQEEIHSFSGSGNASKLSLTDGELVGLCSEFLGAGTEPATAALQWIMANLVKHVDVQEAVRREIDGIVGADAEEVTEEDLGKLEYLHAVLMEALRLHPTVPSVSRQVMPDDHVFLDGHRVVAGTTVQFLLERLARDKTVWAEPDKFLPEREFDWTEVEGDLAIDLEPQVGFLNVMKRPLRAQLTLRNKEA
uniref:Cytochrome P450 89A2 n=1 Tax=Aegilops tauschii TaxID=37682 RepID=R7W9A2_AEGTA